MGRAALISSGMFLVLAGTFWAFGLDVTESLGYLWQGALGSEAGVARTLVRATPLALAGLGIVVAWRAGMYNIGGEGQYVVGGLGGATVAKFLAFLPGPVMTPAILVAGALTGAVYAAFAGWLYVTRGVQVVISTILLNFLALAGLEFALRGPLQESRGQIFVTDSLPNSAMLMRFDRQTDLHAGVFVAGLAVVGVAVFLGLTRAGLRLRLVGDSPSAARANGVDVGRVQVGAMALSGGLCGLAGVVDYAGLTGRLADGFSQNWGFIAIPVALLGGLSAAGTGLSALFFGGLFAGSDVLKRFTEIGNTVVPVVQIGRAHV